MRTLRALAIVIVLSVLVSQGSTAELETLLKPLLAVGPNGAGNQSAAKAWEQLVQVDAGRLPAIIASLDRSGPLAANWIRTAADAIAERQLRRGGKLPLAELEAFVLDKTHSSNGRRWAYELIAQLDPTAKDRLVPGMIDDPSLEMRRDAVAQLIDKGTKLSDNQQAEKRAVFSRAFRAARDVDQVKLLTGQLKQLGIEVDLAKHFGFIVHWKLIGPFDNTDEKGYNTAYPPEAGVDLNASYKGKHKTIEWIDYTTNNDYGSVDLSKIFEKEKDVVGYAMAEFFSKTRQTVQFRTTSFNAIKLWLNGKLIDQHEIYHCGGNLDQYICKGELCPGRNVVLLKICQNNQPQPWANAWEFKLRVCDKNGTGILSTGILVK